MGNSLTAVTWDPAQTTGEWAGLRDEFSQLRADIRRALWIHTITICLLNVLTFGAVVAILR
jgi:hypothetical protein